MEKLPLFEGTKGEVTTTLDGPRVELRLGFVPQGEVKPSFPLSWFQTVEQNTYGKVFLPWSAPDLVPQVGAALVSRLLYMRLGS